jgi:hypothetical protein
MCRIVAGWCLNPAGIAPLGNEELKLIRKRLLLVPVALVAGWWLHRMFKDAQFNISTAAFVLGAAGVLCILGIAFGIWSARRSEARRKAKEDIFIKH